MVMLSSLMFLLWFAVSTEALHPILQTSKLVTIVNTSLDTLGRTVALSELGQAALEQSLLETILIASMVNVSLE